MKIDKCIRPGRPKSEEKREAILQAASELFLERGLQGASMDAVAAGAGVSKQTVYSHFKNKEDLYRAVIVNKVAAYRFEPSALPGEGDLEAVLRELGRRFLELLFDPEVIAMFRIVISESVVHRKIAELFYESGPGSAVAAMELFLGKQVEAGRLRMEDLHYAAVQFLNMVRGEYQMLLLMNMGPEVCAGTRDAHVNKVVSQFLQLYRV